MSKNLSLNNKVVLITGASSGIGLACAKVFAAAGARLVLAARREDELEKHASELKKQGAEVFFVQADVSEEASCKNLIDKTVEHYGSLDILVNNAGISMRSLFEDADIAVLKRLMDVNYWGTVYCCKYALPHLLKSKGSIVGVSSVAGKKGLPGRSGYSASKFAMEGFLETLRTENLYRGLHVLIACPGFTASNIRSVALSGDGSLQGESPRDEKKLMKAETVATEILRALCRRRRDLILSWEGRISVLLNKFFPSWMDKMFFLSMAKEKDSPLRNKA